MRWIAEVFKWHYYPLPKGPLSSVRLSYLSDLVLLIWTDSISDWFAVGFSNNGSLSNADVCVFWSDWRDPL